VTRCCWRLTPPTISRVLDNGAIVIECRGGTVTLTPEEVKEFLKQLAVALAKSLIGKSVCSLNEHFESRVNGRDRRSADEDNLSDPRRLVFHELKPFRGHSENRPISGAPDRELIRISVPGSAYRIPMRFAGLGRSDCEGGQNTRTPTARFERFFRQLCRIAAMPHVTSEGSPGSRGREWRLFSAW